MLNWLRTRLAMRHIPRCSYCGALVDLNASAGRKVCGSEDCAADAALETQLGL